MNSNKIKKIIYSILKEILEGDGIPTAKDYEITGEQFFEILNLMKNEGYLNPKRVSFFISGGVHIQKSIDTITMKGIEFLEQNSNWSKFQKGLKEFREFSLKRTPEDDGYLPEDIIKEIKRMYNEMHDESKE